MSILEAYESGEHQRFKNDVVHLKNLSNFQPLKMTHVISRTRSTS